MHRQLDRRHRTVCVQPTVHGEFTRQRRTDTQTTHCEAQGQHQPPQAPGTPHQQVGSRRSSHGHSARRRHAAPSVPIARVNDKFGCTHVAGSLRGLPRRRGFCGAPKLDTTLRLRVKRRSPMWGGSQVVRQRPAKPPSVGSNPILPFESEGRPCVGLLSFWRWSLRAGRRSRPVTAAAPPVQPRGTLPHRRDASHRAWAGGAPEVRGAEC